MENWGDGNWGTGKWERRGAGVIKRYRNETISSVLLIVAAFAAPVAAQTDSNRWFPRATSTRRPDTTGGRSQRNASAESTIVARRAIW